MLKISWFNCCLWCDVLQESKKFKRLKKARADADGGHSGFSDEEEYDGTGKGGRSAENQIGRSLFDDDGMFFLNF